VWNGEKLGRFVAVDTETEVRPFTETPEIVTCQACDGQNVYYVPLDKIDDLFKCDSVFIFHNAPFDIDVICKHMEDCNYFHQLILEDRIRDTQLLYKLVHLAEIGFIPFKSSLAFLSEKFLNEVLEKDEKRENFAQFKGVSIADIPTEYLDYGARDAIATYHIYHSLHNRAKSSGSSTLLSHQIQLVGALALNRIYKRGIGFDLKNAQAKLEELSGEMRYHAAQLLNYGWERGRKGSKEKYEYIIKTYCGLNLPKTESGDISSKREDLEPYKYHPFVYSYLKFHELEKLTTFIRDIESDRIHPRYNPILNTGRTSCSNPNFQQLPREGGIRELFVAKPGHTFIITDYSAIELATLAQITYKRYGFSKMRDMINDGIDLHKYYASVMHECDLDEVTKQWRQEAKAANFGFPGGLGIETFIEFSKGYGLELTPSVAQEMKNVWFTAFPEMEHYMNEVEKDEAVFTMSGRKRANASFCARKNTPFQGAAADGAKLALYELERMGIDVVGFVHDEIISEVPLGSEHAFKQMQEETMIEQMKIICPDVRVSVETTISEVYTK
jgi:DNA polymerase-1